MQALKSEYGHFYFVWHFLLFIYLTIVRGVQRLSGEFRAKSAREAGCRLGSVSTLAARVYLTGAPNSRMFQRSHPALAQPVVLADELGVRMCPIS